MRSTAGAIKPALTWFLVALLLVALVWLWWNSDRAARTPPARPVPETSSSKTPSLLDTNPAATFQQPPILTNPPPVLNLIPTSRPPVRVTAPTNPPARAIATATSSNTPPALVVMPPSELPAGSSMISTTNLGDADAKFRQTLAVQLALARLGISPGSMDGASGSQTRAALKAFQEREGLAATGEPDADTLARLHLPEETLTRHVVTSAEIARLRPTGKTWLAKSEQDRLDYETVLELVAEKYAANPRLIQRLNPGVDWTRVMPGTALVVPAFEPLAAPGKAAWVKIFLGGRILQAFDENSRLLVQYPCSIAQRIEKRPTGETLRVSVVAPNPNYTFNPAVFPESPEAQTIGRKLILHPGPNNPVGVAWIGLDKSGYGIHGTPMPEQVGRTESHGCFRLANWNVEQLRRMVSVGMPVLVDP